MFGEYFIEWFIWRILSFLKMAAGIALVSAGAVGFFTFPALTPAVITFIVVLLSLALVEVIRDILS